MENKNKKFLGRGELKISEIVEATDEKAAEDKFEVTLRAASAALQHTVKDIGIRVESRSTIYINELPERNQNAKSSTK